MRGDSYAMWLEAIPFAEDHETRCPTCGGAVRRRTYDQVYGGSFILDGKRLDIRKQPPADFADPIVLDPLTQYFDGKLYRLWPSDRYFKRIKRLHRAVWEAVFGPIPKDCHIHHRDNDRANNALSNLECLPVGEHLSDNWHRTRNVTRGRQGSDGRWVDHFSENARRKAAEWHASEEGRLWHRRNAQATRGWEKFQRVEKACEVCGQLMQALVRRSRPQKYCSEVCKARAWRERHKSQPTG